MSSLQNGGPAISSAQQGMAGLSVGNGVGPGAMVAVGKVKNVSLPAPDLSQVKSVDTHTKALGIISPPPDLRAIIDKSAAFVAKNGISFEAKIMEQQKDNPRFSFLRATDPYHKYYRWKVQQVQSGETGVAGSKEQQSQQAADLAQQPVQVAPSVAPAKPLEPPQPDQYTVRTPEGLTAEHLDIIKLTAQCVARNGQSFLTGLVQREQGNPTFHFLKPTHSLFGYFKDLCDAYSRTLMPNKDLVARLKKDAIDRTALLERCLKRLEWEKQRDAADKAASDKAEAERIAMQSIDWHDFAVVETIDFFDDEDAELPPPMTQKDVILLNRAGAFQDEEADAAAAERAAGGDEMEMDDEEKAMVQEGNAGPSQAAGEAQAAPPVADRHAFVRTEEEDEAPMRIVKDYQRPSARTGQSAAGMAISPITGELVPLSEMAEHMRISLIDPQWKVQREAMLSKIRETTQASDDEISRNLVDLAGHRPDVFGSTQEEVGAIVKANIDDKKISGNDRAVVWDGETRSGPDLRNQLDAIAENKAAGEKRKFPEKPMLPTPILGPAPPTAPASSLPPPPAAKPTQPNSLPPPPVRVPPPVMPPPTLKPTLPAPPPPVIQRPPPTLPPPQLPPPQLPPRIPPPPVAAAAPPRAPPPGPPPPGAPGLPPQPSESEAPDPKRQRLDFVLQDEAEFLEQHPGSSKVRILCPSEADNEHLNGQVLDVEVASLGSTIGELKARLAEVLALPPNKQQLSREHFKTLRDNDSLAYYNVLPDVELTLSVRRRGGR